MNKQKLKPLFLVLLGLLVMLPSVEAFGRKDRKISRKKAEKNSKKFYPKPSQGDPNERFREDPSERAKWFLFQRTYPFDSIPVEARRKALASIPKNVIKTEQQSSQRWNLIGPAPTSSFPFPNWGLTSGRINAIAVSPSDPQTVLVGASTGGIWRSTDAGNSFVPTSDDQVDLAVGALAFSKSDPSIVYSGMGDIDNNYFGTGVLKSTDTGRSWTRVNNSSLPTNGQASQILVDPSDPNLVYLALFARLDSTSNTRFASGFFLSTNGGVDWVRTLPGLPRDLVADTADPNTLYLGMTRVDLPNMPPGVYRSTDKGATWRVFLPLSFSPAVDVRLAVTPADSRVLYAFVGGITQNSFNISVMVTRDGGNNWTNLGSSNFDTGQFAYNTYISADPRDPNTVYLGSRDVYKSTNGGTSWTNLNNSFTIDGDFTPFSSNAHPDQHCFAFAPNDSNTFYIGNDGGLYKSTDAGRSFFSLNQTLALTQSYGLTINPNDSAISYTGTQDNGLQKRVDSRGGWRELLTGDYGKVVFTKSEPNNFFANVFFGNILKFSNDEFNDVAATSSTFGENEGRPRIAFIAPFKGNGVDDTLYFGTWRLFVSTNLGRTWSPPAGTLDLTRGGTDVLNTIAVSNVNPNVIYVGSRQGRAMTSTDAGRNWRDISMGLPNRTITDIAIDRNNPAIAYLSVSGFGSKHIFFTDNGGTTWRDVDGNLPNIPVNTVLIDPRQSNVVYLGTDIGIFRSTTGGSQWDLFNNGLPPVVVMDLESHSDGTIQAATYGRSVYQLSAPSSDTVVPTVTVGTPNGGETINAGSQVTINWTSSDNIGVTRHDIALSTDGGSTFPVSIANGLQGNAQSFVWSVPQIDTAQARIRVTAIDDAANRGADASDNNFRIVGNDTVVPVVTVLSPNGGENIIAGSSFTISWRSSDDRSISRHNIDLSTDGGSTFPVSIASGLSADAQTFVWSVPQIDTGQARVRVTAIDQANNQGADVSNANFNIANRDFQLEFAQPNITLSRRGSTDATLNIIRTGGFDGAVTVTVPADLKALKLKITPTMQSSTGSTLSFNIKAKRGTPRGTIRIAFVGRDSAGTTRQATLMLTVQ